MIVTLIDGSKRELKVGDATLGMLIDSVEINYEDIKNPSYESYMSISVYTRLYPHSIYSSMDHDT